MADQGHHFGVEADPGHHAERTARGVVVLPGDIDLHPAHVDPADPFAERDLQGVVQVGQRQRQVARQQVSGSGRQDAERGGRAGERLGHGPHGAVAAIGEHRDRFAGEGRARLPEPRVLGRGGPPGGRVESLLGATASEPGGLGVHLLDLGGVDDHRDVRPLLRRLVAGGGHRGGDRATAVGTADDQEQGGSHCHGHQQYGGLDGVAPRHAQTVSLARTCSRSRDVRPTATEMTGRGGSGRYRKEGDRPPHVA